MYVKWVGFVLLELCFNYRYKNKLVIMNSEMHPINYKLSNDKNQFMLASAINT